MHDECMGDWVWKVFEQPPALRRETARDLGHSLAEAVIRAKGMLDDEGAWAQWPVQMRRYADELGRRRAAGRVLVRR